ncbi:4-coumarate--CoA ligase family protein [Xylanimonas allomyrinae]|uniref:4-coumarate--CoA ligase family protein n=1 Tax=Xylanimonas allomyrinae TaxID=2509459 RepID=A0A4P6EHT1_9MICO|nr:AMP-binding protein [Xylanimonas allomyrinae]QAY62100.1 4-coumarate--CoA ligase family protein [Xylanimonas allomyrinae]
MVIRSLYPDVAIPDLTLYDFLFASLDEIDLDRVAVVDGPSGATTTYGGLRAQVDALAGSFAARGFGVGDVVALHSPNVPAFVAVFHGLLRAGVTVTTVNALASGEEIARQLTASGARALLTVSPLLAAAAAGAAAAGIDDVVVLDRAEGYPALADLPTGPVPDVTIDPRTHLAVLPYSSGTVGLPKGVMLTHRNLVANVVQGVALVGATRDDVVPAVLPFFHIYGMTVLLNLALHARARLVTLPRFDLGQFLQVCEREKATYLFVAPPMALALAKHPLVAEHDLSSVRVVLSGAAPLDAALADAVAHRLDTRVVQGYGMSEMSPVSHLVPADRPDIAAGSIGLLVPNMEARVVDPGTGQDAARGELLCRGPNVMVGYLDDDAATRDAFDDDGFLHTGDIVEVDDEGVFTVVDRLKELIKYKGYQVAPAELEALLLRHPSIADAAVIGLPDPEAGEVPKAYVVPAPGVALTPGDVVEYVTGHVAPYKKVREVELVESVPKSAAGKILRKQLRQLEEDRRAAL